MNRLIKTAITAIFIAWAAPASASQTVPHPLVIYNGPGLHHGRKATIAPGEAFETGVCNPVWCHIRTKNLKGWVQTGKIIKNPGRQAGISGTTGSHGKGGNSTSFSLRLVVILP